MKASHLMWTRYRAGKATRKQWRDTVVREHKAYMAKNFKVSDTPRSGPEGISGHPGTPGPPNNKEIA